MLVQHAVDDIMAPIYADFQRYVHNETLVDPLNDELKEE